MIIADPITSIIVGLTSAVGGMEAAGAIATYAAVGVGGAMVGSSMAKSRAGGGNKVTLPEMPKAGYATAQPIKTATAKPQTSTQEEINRKQAASLLVKNWPTPTLGTAGLLG